RPHGNRPRLDGAAERTRRDLERGQPDADSTGRCRARGRGGRTDVDGGTGGRRRSGFWRRNVMLSPILVVALVVVLYIISSVHILSEYERGVIFRLGKLLPQAKGPGVALVFRPIDRMVRMSLRTVVLDVPPQDIIT